MKRLGRLGRWWWRWLIGWAILAAAGLLAVLILPLTGLLPRPSVLGSLPAPGARDLPPRSEITLRFSTPMDRSSVEDAIRLEPEHPGAWDWPDRQTAIRRPETAWTPATTYTLSLGNQAQSLLRQSLSAPFSLTFSIAPAPALTFRAPAPGALVPAQSPLVLRFDRPILPPEVVASTPLPALSLTPPVSTTARWYDERTVVVTADFAPAATYTATIAGLTDIVGTAVQVAPWSFRTAAPALLAFSPPDRQRIALSKPLSLTFAGALSPAAVDLITRSFQLQPPLTATWRLAAAPGPRPGTTLLFEPAGGWLPQTAYTASLALPDGETHSWHWRIEPELSVLGTVPGRNGILAPDAELRLILSTALPDGALAERLAIDPPVPGLEIRHNGAQLRITGDFAPSRSYTLTLREDGSPPFELPFRTGGPSRSLAIVAPAAAQSLWAPGDTPQIGLALSGLSEVSLALYPLDRPLLTTLLLNPELPFAPDRYGLAPDRSWTLASDGGAAWQASVPITGTADGAPLAGGYLVLAGDGRGLTAQHLLIVSPYRISASANPTTLSVWALDSRSRQPAPDLPLLVLRGNSQIAEGRTG
ncbi:MAG TPA: Ig-like domain-containing protein, partial [Herpetosiphonaceae bacterium]|nr:Ig-like domain-containing protein [Herpetosiphonaceae bacterium]